MSTTNGAETEGAPTARALVRATATALRHSVAAYRAAWFRLFAAAILISLAGFGVVLFFMSGLATLATGQRDLLVGDDGQLRGSGLALLALEVGVPALLALGALGATWLGAVARLAEAAMAGERVTLPQALGRGARRVPAVLGAASIALGACAGLAIATSALMAVGVAGLVLTPAVALVRRWRPSLRWPRPRTLLLLLIPFSSAVRRTLRWSLLVPSAALERNRPRAALQRSRALVAAGDARIMAAVLAASLGLSFGAQRAAMAIASLAGATAIQTWTVRSVTQFAVAALPVVAATVLFREARSDGDPDPRLAIVDPPPRAPGPVRRATVVALVWLLVGTASAGVLAAAAAPASAATRSFTVDSLGDESDDDLTDGACRTPLGTCTLRAALDEANSVPADDVEIGFAVDGVIYTSSPLVVTSSVVIDGGVRHVVISGRACASCAPSSQLLRATNAASTLGLANLSFRDGVAVGDNGGGALETVATTAVTNVSFAGHSSSNAPGGAVSVLAGTATIINATFVGNTAVSGADLLNRGTTSVHASTFSGAAGSSVLVAGSGAMTMDSSIVTGSLEANCTGAITGATNLSDDGTCPGSLGPPTGLGSFGPHGGAVETIDLTASSNAVDAGSPGSCPPTDARGVARPQGAGCDIGAYEYVPTASTIPLTVDDLADDVDAVPGDGACATVGGGCTLRAAVDEANAQTAAAGAVSVLSFDVGFAVDGTITLGSTLVVTSLLHLDGAGQHVTVDGGGAVRLFDLAVPGRPATLANLTLANGSTAAPAGGGAIHSNGWGRVERVTFTGNESTDPDPSSAGGGAVAVDFAPGASFEVVNSTFVGNRAPAASGGGDIHARGTVTVDHSTFAGATGGAIAVAGPPAALTLAGSLVSSASGANCGGAIAGADNISSDASCPGTTLTDPGYASFGDHGGWVPTVGLLLSSPAIDPAGASPCPATDARGVARPQGGACDLGAVEASSDATVGVSGDVNPAPAGATVTITAAVADAFDPAPATGEVELFAGATPIGSGVLSAGSVSITTAALPEGTHTIEARYAGDGYYPPASGTYVQAITPADPAATAVAVTSAPDPTVFGERATFTATVTAVPPATGVATGSVTFADGATVLGTAALDATGVATLDVTSLEVGAHTITATYSGDAGFLASSGGDEHTVDRAASATASSSSASPAVTGQSITITATVIAVAPGAGFPSGTVDVFDGSTLLGSGSVDAAGQAEVTIGSLPVGSHAIGVEYRGDSRFAASTAPALAQVVDRAASTTALTAGTNPSVSGQAIAFTATVAPVAPGVGVPGGTVELREGATVLGSAALDVTGHATFAPVALPTGSHGVLAVYLGDPSFGGSIGPELTQTVEAAGSSTSLVSDLDPAAVGQPVTFTATVVAVAPGAGVPTGTVDFLDGMTALGSGTLDAAGAATFATSSLGVGTHSITASYRGTVEHRSSTSPALAQRVGVAAASIAVTSSANPAVVGEAVTISATVGAVPAGAVPTGTADLLDGGTVIGTATLDPAGVVVFPTSTLGIGAHTLTVAYHGDGNVGAGSSAPLNQVVEPAATATALVGSPAPSVVGQPVTLTATVTAVAPGAGVPAGTVDFVDGATVIGTAPLDGAGVATFTTSALGVGAHPLSAAYAGTPSFTGSTSAVHGQDVLATGSNVGLSVSADPTVTGESVTFTAVVTASPPGRLPTGSVTFTDGATVLGEVTLDASGTATLTVSDLAVGGHTITATYAGDGTVGAGVSAPLPMTREVAGTTVTLASALPTSVSGESVTFRVAVAAVAPGAGTPTGAITILDGSTPVGTAVLDASGTVTFATAALAVGAHDLTASYAGDAGFAPSSSPTVRQTVVRGSTLVNLGANPNPSIAGQIVTFRATAIPEHPASGVPSGSVDFFAGADLLGTRPVDPSGRATFTTSSFAGGTHTVTARYSGDASFHGATSDPLTQQVVEVGSSISLAAAPSPTVAGENVRFTAIVAPLTPGPVPTGLVRFMDGASVLGFGDLDGTGTAVLDTAGLSVGTHAIAVRYLGDGTVGAGVSAPLVHTVAAASTALALVASAPTGTVGVDVTFTATVTVDAPGSGWPSGDVRFYDGPTLLGTVPIDDATGVASFTTGALGAGPHAISASYAGDPSFVASSAGPVTYDVVSAGSAVTATLLANPVTYPLAATVTAAVATVPPGVGPPTGIVTFAEGATVFGSSPLDAAGAATFTLPTLAAGDHDLTVTYAGDATVEGSSTTISLRVDAAATQVTLSSAANPATYPAQPRLVAAVTAAGGSIPTGAVDVYVDGRLETSVPLDAAGTGAFDLARDPGTYSVIVIYWGDANHAMANAVRLSQTIDVGASETMLTVGPADAAVFGQAITMTASVAPAGATAPTGTAPTGAVDFLDGATVVGSATLVGTTAVLTTGVLPAGHRALTARYQGDARYGISASPGVAYDVEPAATTVDVTGAPNPSTSGHPVTLTATVAAVAPGGGTPTGTVTFVGGGDTLGAVALDAGGRATLVTTALPAGRTAVVATYHGSNDHLGSSGAVDQVVDRAPTTAVLWSSVDPSVTGQAVTLTAIVDVPAPGTGPATGTVSFYRSNNRLLGTATLDGTGRAELTVTSLFGNGGVEQLVAQYHGDAQRAGSFATRNQTIERAATAVTIVATPNPVAVGQQVVLTATVVPVAPGGGVPSSGTVTFTDNGTAVATVPVTNGVATIVRSTPDDLGAFPHLIGAAFAGGPAGNYADATAPEVVVTVGKATPTITLVTDASAVETGQAVTLTALLGFPAGAPAPAGAVAIYEGSPDQPAGARLVGSGPVALLETPCPPPNQGSPCQQPGFSIVVPDRPLGAHSFFAATAGDGSYLPGTSPALTLTITPVPTALLVLADPPQTLPGDRVRYTAYVRNAGTAPANEGIVPTGTVTFTDDTSLGQVHHAPVTVVPDASIPGLAVATFDHEPFGPGGTYHLRVTFTPAGSFQAQVTTVDHLVRRHDSTLDVSMPTTVVWDAPVDVLTHVTPANGSTTAPNPTGAVTVESTDGQTCASSPVHGGCRLRFPDPGVHHITVRYAGDGSYAPAADDPITVVVTKRPSSVSARVDPVRPITGEPVEMSWQVQGPSAGAVRARVGAVACSTALTDRCATTFPLAAAGQAVPVAVVYDGDDRWLGSQFATTLVPLGCYLVPVAVYPSDAGTMAITTPRNCNGGQGYLEGTAVTTVVSPAAPALDVQFVPDTQHPTGRAGYTQTFVVGPGPGQSLYATASFGRVGQCVELEVARQLIAPAGGAFVPSTAPNCPGVFAPRSTGSSTIYSYARGTTVSFTATTFGAASRFYGVRTQRPSFFGDGPIAPLASAMVLLQDTYVEGVFGPACFDVTVVPNGSGTGSVDTPKNCADPARPGWSTGTQVTMSARATAPGAYLASWGITAVDTTGTTATDPVTGTTIYRNTAVVGSADLVVDVRFTTCVALRTETIGLGTIEVADAPNCPDRTAVEADRDADLPTEIRWYTADSPVELTAKVGDQRIIEFGKWTGEEERFSQTITVRLGRDQTRRASFHEYRDCDPLTLRTEPPDWGVVNARGILADDVCRNGDLRPEVPAAGKSGRFVGGQVVFEARATKGDPLVGFTLSHPAGLVETADSFASPTLGARLSRPTTATATFCQAIRPRIDIVGPDGVTYRVPTVGDDPTKPPAAGAPPWAAGISAEDADFMTAFPEPNCPYRSDAWIVGTSVTFLARAASEGYTFRAWDGARTSSFFAVDLTFDGSTNSKDLGVTYEAVCHTVTLSGNEADVHPQPNCPGADPDAMAGAGTRVGSYIGGTTVVLRAEAPDGKVWEGWTGDVDESGTTNPNWVTVCPKPVPDPEDPTLAELSTCSKGDPSGNKVVAHRWRDKTVGEKIAAGAKKFFTDAGNAIAIGLKKAVGVVAGALGEFFFGVPPMGVLSLLVDIGSVVGLIFEKLGVPELAKAMRYAQETVNYMKSAFTCPAKWGLAASPVVPPLPPDLDEDGMAIVAQEIDRPTELTEQDYNDLIDLAVAAQMAQITDDPDGVLRQLAYEQVSKELMKWRNAKKAFSFTELAKAIGIPAYDQAKAWWDARKATKAQQRLADLLFAKQVREAQKDVVDIAGHKLHVTTEMLDRAKEIEDAAAKAATKAANPGLAKRTWTGTKKAVNFLRKHGDTISRVAGHAALVGTAAYALATTPTGWDNNATEAWTNGDVLYECMHNAVPSYIPMPEYDPEIYR